MKTAVILYNLGGPATLKDVQPFLREMFSDRAILNLPALPRFFLAWLISSWRSGTAKKIYEKIGGGSPILRHTKEQAAALQAVLSEETKVFIAMRYAAPRVCETVRALRDARPDRIVHLPLYPQYSGTTTESSFREFKKEENKGESFKFQSWIRSYSDAPFFIETLLEKTQPLYEKARRFGKPLLIFSAHGLPKSVIEKGDPYQAECEATYRALVVRTKEWEAETCLAYQSRLGPVEWIGPHTDALIEKAAQAGRPLVVIPIAFVSEHSETLVELGMEYADLAVKNGAPFYAVAETAGTTPRFIHGLAALVRKELEE